MMNDLKKNRFLWIICLLGIIGILYVFNPYKLEYVGYQSKVWAHRVNSLPKLHYTARFYSGIELDLVYDSVTNTFDVNHPPAPSIGLDLGTYFSEIKGKELKLWLDIKNLSSHNTENASETLNNLVRKHQLKHQNILVESTEIECLMSFRTKGFQTSFYLPQLVDLEDETKLLPRIDSIKDLLKQFPTDAVSGNANCYEILQTHFKEKQKYLWHIYKPYSRHQIENYRNF